MSSMNIMWLILLPPFLIWYPTSILSSTLVIGIIATMKSSGGSESPWKIILLMLTYANLVPELVRIVFQLGIVYLEMYGVFLCTIHFQAILLAMSVVSCRRPSCSLSMPYSGWFSSLAVHHHHFVNQQLNFGAAALPSTAFLLVGYGVCLFQIVVQPFTEDAGQ